MRKRRLAAWCGLVAMILHVGAACAQGIFRTELKKKYGFRTVSCYTCHARVPSGTENPKQYRNDFGKLFEARLKGKNVTARLKEVKGLKRGDPRRASVESDVRQQFLEVLKKVEQLAYPGGGTYADALRDGKIDGIKLKK